MQVLGPSFTIFLLPCSGVGVRTGPHHCCGGHSDGSGCCMPTEPLQSLHTFLHQSSQPEPETRGRAAAGKCEPGSHSGVANPDKGMAKARKPGSPPVSSQQCRGVRDFGLIVNMEKCVHCMHRA